MGKPRQRAVDIPGLQHQSGRCGSRASGRTSKESIVNGRRPTATLPVKDFIMANDCSIARMGSSTASSEKLRHKLAKLSHGGKRTVAPSPCLVEPVFSAAASFGICAIANFPSGSRQGIRIGDTDSLVLMIRNFNP